MHKNLVSEIGYTASVYDFNGVHINDAIDLFVKICLILKMKEMTLSTNIS